MILPRDMTSLISTSDPPVPSTSLREKLVNIFVSPGEVFEEVVAAPHRPANWLVPTLLVCVGGIILLGTPLLRQHGADAVQQLMTAGSVSATQAGEVGAAWVAISALTLCAGAFAGTFWAALMLWLIGRVLLRAHFPFMKAVEVVALAGIVLVLGTVFTALLVWNFSDSAAWPVMPLVSDELDFGRPAGMALNAINIFHLWTTTVLAIGLSKLSRSSFKESAFWVFGYWVLVRIALIALAPPLSGGN